MPKYSRKIEYATGRNLQEMELKKMLQLALENEVEKYVEKHSHLTGEDEKRTAAGNGYMRQRDITTGMGPLTIKQPRVGDRGLKKYGHTRFTSNILPKYMRRIPSVDNLLPVLYLRGISTNDFSTALSSILGKVAPGLSAANILRLKYGRMNAGSERKGIYLTKLTCISGRMAYILTYALMRTDPAC